MDSDSSDEPVPRDRSERDEDAQPAFVLGTASFSSSSTRNAKVHRAPPKNFGAFEKHTKGIGLKLLLKMGYSPGQGLGADGSGISAPIDVKLRPKGMGIGHGGFDERPKSVIAQSKKDTVDVDDHPEPRWRKKSRRRIFMTAQELIAEQDSLPVPSIAEPISTKIRDMTGSVPKLIDLANLAEKPIPELVHNIQLLSSMSKTSLLHLARQIKIETKNMAKERGNLQALQDYLVISKSKLHTAQDIHILLSECKDNQQLVFGLDQVHLIYGGVLDQLLESHLPQVKSLSLDTHITALLCPVFKTAFKDWSLFQDPSRGLPILKDYRRLIVRFGTGSMSPYEAMMYNYWLPCVRHTIKYCISDLVMTGIRTSQSP